MTEQEKLPSYEEIFSGKPEEAPEFKPTPGVEEAVAEAQAAIGSRSFSGRNPHLGKMMKCQVCKTRHRAPQCEQKFKYLHTLEDTETGEKTDIFATVPLPEQIERGLRAQPPKKQFPRAIMGAAMTKGKRKHPHFSAVKLQFIELTRKYFQGDPDPASEDYEARITKARKKAGRKIRRRARRANNVIRLIQETSRRINRGFAPNQA